MDRGFYSEENINDFFRNHKKFFISVKMSLAFIRKELDPVYDVLQGFENYNDKYGLYCTTVRTVWNYSQDRPYKGDTLQEERRLYIHYYYNIEKAAEDKMAFDRRLNALKQELEMDNRVPEHEKLYQKYFLCKSTQKRGTKATVNEEVITKAKRYFGFFSLIGVTQLTFIIERSIYINNTNNIRACNQTANGC